MTSNQPLLKAAVTPSRAVPAGIARPDYSETGTPKKPHAKSRPVSSEMLARIRHASRAARRVLDRTAAAVKPGITSDQLDAIAHEASISEGAYPSPLNYSGFPKSICTSVNEVICHGIPDMRPLADGDIINIDITLFLDGVHGDCSKMVLVGNVDEEAKKLCEVTYDCMMRGIKTVRPGGRVRDIGRAITKLARQNGYSVVRAFCGHGIGETFHNDLMIPHNYDPNARTKLKPGLVFTIEPMINMGSWRHKIWEDDWTAVTIDGKLSAQYEHTVVVTDKGVEILTVAEGEQAFY